MHTKSDVSLVTTPRLFRYPTYTPLNARVTRVLSDRWPHRLSIHPFNFPVRLYPFREPLDKVCDRWQKGDMFRYRQVTKGFECRSRELKTRVKEDLKSDRRSQFDRFDKVLISLGRPPNWIRGVFKMKRFSSFSHGPSDTQPLFLKLK